MKHQKKPPKKYIPKTAKEQDSILNKIDKLYPEEMWGDIAREAERENNE